jgi:hypothetical protein
MSAPGWYRDPSQPGALRWWDGERWSEHRAAAPPVVQPYYAKDTDGYAIASILTAVFGIPIAPIILGHIARNRIRESNGMLEGDGLAIAGLVIGYLTLALIAIVIIVLVAVAAGTSSSGSY